MTDDRTMPSGAFIVAADGTPVGHVDFDKLTTDATLFMYALAETAGDDDATDKVAAEWVGRMEPTTYGYVAAGALSLLVRHILGPTLDACDAVGLELRKGLRAAAADARRDLGGNQ